MDICTWHDCIYHLILFNYVHSSLQWRICFSVSRCAQAGIRAHCSYDNKQIPVKQLRWIRERGGRVGSTCVEKYCMLFECLSGQVDWEQEICCQAQDLYRRVWKVPFSLQACSFFFPCTSFLIPSHFLPHSFDINVSRWREISPPVPSLHIPDHT